MKKNKMFINLSAVYLAYLAHGIQGIMISQNSAEFAVKWGTDLSGVAGVIAWTGLAKFLTVWICGELSDRIGRKPMLLTGAVMYVVVFGGLLTTSNIVIASICAFLGGAATSFFDGSLYPGAQESYPKSPGTALIMIKAFVSFSGILYPFLVGSLQGTALWSLVIIVPLIMSVILLILSLFTQYTYDESLKAAKASSSSEDAAQNLIAKDLAKIKRKPNRLTKVLCIAYGGIAMMTFYVVQQFLTQYGVNVIGMSDMSARSLVSIYTGGSIAAVFLWASLMAKAGLKPLFVLLIDTYGTVISLLLLCFVRVPQVTVVSAFAIGFFAAGGALQTGLTVMSEFYPGKKGRNLGIYYTAMGAASYLGPAIISRLVSTSGEIQGILNGMYFNLAVAVIGAFSITYLCLSYKKTFEVSVFERTLQVAQP